MIDSRSSCGEVSTALTNDTQIVNYEDATTSHDLVSNPGGVALYPVAQHAASLLATYAWTNLWIWIIISSVLSCVGLSLGDLSLTVETKGWLSKGTLIAKQNIQARLVRNNADKIWSGGETIWKELIDNDRHQIRTRRAQAGNLSSTDSLFFQAGDLPGCDIDYYTGGNFLHDEGNLWAIWKTTNESVSALEPSVMRDICISEKDTQDMLYNHGLCGGCDDGCLPPISLVTFAHIFVGDRSMSFDCDELVHAWDKVAMLAKQVLVAAAASARKEVHKSKGGTVSPNGIAALLVDSEFGENGNENVHFTSSMFSTVPSGRSMRDVLGLLHKLNRAEDSGTVSGVYVVHGDDANISAEFLSSDLKLVVGSFIANTLAVLLHTQSPWLTIVALIQISLSFPVAYFFYAFVAGIGYFPFINFVALFVVFAVGADDVFVAVDKWKNARLQNPSLDTESIARVALPPAAGSMLQTTMTSAIAFFATAICPVPAMRLFGVFSGMLILCNYFLCIGLIFPAICIYDRRNQKRQCRLSQMNSKPSFIRSALTYYSTLVGEWRTVCLLIVALAGATSIFFAMKLSSPSSPEIRLLRPGHEFEIGYRWQSNLLASTLTREKGSRVLFLWGVSPADTGDPNNPEDKSNLVLDDTFDPAPEINQLYLLNFCDELHNQSFAEPDSVGSLPVCPMSYFQNWIDENASLNSTTTELVCGNATRLPIPEASFHACFSEFVRVKRYTRVLIRDGKVVIIQLPYRQAGVSWLSNRTVLSKGWADLDKFTASKNAIAPIGVNKSFGSSTEFWWYDSNESILAAFAGTVAIALGAAFIVVLVSTQSLVVTGFAVISIGFILVSSAGALAVMGWELGVLESVCFAILIGISCDFVLHFSHSYCGPVGFVSSHERTKYALEEMGPSILAAAMTTITASVVLLFSTLNTFYMFGTVLFWSLIMGAFGSLFVFTVLIDTFGPSAPCEPCCLRESAIPAVVIPSQVNKFATLLKQTMGMIPQSSAVVAERNRLQQIEGIKEEWV